MNKVKINGLLAVYISYLQCLQINFEDLNCHSCKSKEKLKHRRNKGNHGNDSVSNNFDTVNLDHNKTLNNDCRKCNCGKKSKGLCGLKVHQRSCRAITSLSSSNFVIDNIKQMQQKTASSQQITNKMNSLFLKKMSNYQSHLRIGIQLICIFTQNYQQST